VLTGLTHLLAFEDRWPRGVIFFDKKEGRAEAWTDKLWVYDLRTNQHFTLKQKQSVQVASCSRGYSSHTGSPT
jgi:hypothetical protein